MARPKRMADCHTEQRHKAKGLCGACYALKQRKENPDKLRLWRKSKSLCPEYKKRNRTRSIEYRKENPHAWRISHLVREFGITVEMYDEMLAAQGGVCAICSRPSKTKRLAVDHEHVLG